MYAQQGNGHGHSHTDSVVKIKSLPFDANQLDIIQFFDGFKLKPNGVQLVVRSDNKPTGEVGRSGGPEGSKASQPQAAFDALLCILLLTQLIRLPFQMQAFVDFESPEEAQRAIRDKDHKVFSEKFGDRYVRLIQVCRVACAPVGRGGLQLVSCTRRLHLLLHTMFMLFCKPCADFSQNTCPLHCVSNRSHARRCRRLSPCALVERASSR
jgi:hypothetical protein